MKTTMEKVTPKVAREWLKKNTDNRDLRPSHVETLRMSFARGEYVATHQGIAFDAEGVLVDGQHRLSAIALLPDEWENQIMVTRGLDRAETFPVIDAVQAKRNTSDVLRTERGVGECANFFAKLYAGRTTGITPVYVEPFARWVADDYADLTTFCGTCTRTWSSAPVRAAAVMSMKIGNDRDYVKLIYGALIHSDFNSMPPVVQALFRAYSNGTVRASAAYDIFARCLKVFDQKNATLKKVQINDQSVLMHSVREVIDAQVFGKKKRAAPMMTAAHKSVPGSNYQLPGL